jgi:hypothetical protein
MRHPLAEMETYLDLPKSGSGTTDEIFSKVIRAEGFRSPKKGEVEA